MGLMVWLLWIVSESLARKLFFGELEDFRTRLAIGFHEVNHIINHQLLLNIRIAVEREIELQRLP